MIAAIPDWIVALAGIVAALFLLGSVAWMSAIYVKVCAIHRELKGNAEDHREFWARLNKHDQQLANHDGRIVALEGRP